MSSEKHNHPESPDFESLDAILEAEKKAKEIIEAAVQKKAEMLEKARKDAIESGVLGQKNLVLDREKDIESAKKGIESQKNSLLAQTEKQANELLSDSKERAKKEIDFLVKKFLGEVDA